MIPMLLIDSSRCGSIGLAKLEQGCYTYKYKHQHKYKYRQRIVYDRMSKGLARLKWWEQKVTNTNTNTHTNSNTNTNTVCI